MVVIKIDGLKLVKSAWGKHIWNCCDSLWIVWLCAWTFFMVLLSFCLQFRRKSIWINDLLQTVTLNYLYMAFLAFQNFETAVMLMHLLHSTSQIIIQILFCIRVRWKIIRVSREMYGQMRGKDDESEWEISCVYFLQWDWRLCSSHLKPDILIRTADVFPYKPNPQRCCARLRMRESLLL